MATVINTTPPSDPDAADVAVGSVYTIGGAAYLKISATDHVRLDTGAVSAAPAQSVKIAADPVFDIYGNG